MKPLNFPAYEFDIRTDEGYTVIFDPVRRKYVKLTPEEWVRQHLVQYLINDLGFPAGYASVEPGFQYSGTPVRADVIMHDHEGHPVLMAECKAPEVKIKTDVFDQLARYNSVIQATYLVATNGLAHYCCTKKDSREGYRFLEAIPTYLAA